MAFIYRLVRIGTNRCYVGRTKNHVGRRWAVHRADLRKGRHPSPHLQKAWDKYGEVAFQFELLEECETAKMVDREQWYIDNLNSCYNYSRDAISPSLTPEIVAKIVEANLREYANATPEERARRAKKPDNFSETMSRALKGKPASPARLQILVKARQLSRERGKNPIGRSGYTGATGRKDSEDTVEKRRASRLATEAERREQGIIYVWITNGTNDQKILSTDALPEGWRIGRKPSFAENARTNRSGETRDEAARENMRRAQLATNEARRAAGEVHHNAGVQQQLCWITDGVKAIRHLKSLPIPDGFRRGRK